MPPRHAPPQPLAPERDDHRPSALRRVLDSHALRIHFQPIFQLSDGALLGSEALMRGPDDSPLRTPDQLFAEARRDGSEIELEFAAARAAAQAFAEHRMHGYLFVNLSAPALISINEQRLDRLCPLQALGLAPNRLVIELTEGSREPNPGTTQAALESLRALGASIALDDYGTGHANLLAWITFRPDFLKIDRHFVHGVSNQPLVFNALRAIIGLAESVGTKLIAEGIESENDLALVRDLGIRYGQGYLLGRPQARPSEIPSAAARKIMGSRLIAVFPEGVRTHSREWSIGQLIVSTPHVGPETPNDAVLALFNDHPSLAVLPVLARGKPIGLINRRAVMDQYAVPYYREVYGRRPCTKFIEHPPVTLDKSSSIDDVAELLANQEQHWIADGVAVTDAGAFMGIATGEQIVRALTEVRIASARYANPLTFLPGNVPIQRHIERLLANREGFVACYCDLNHFKAFNDQFGYAAGDRMLKLVARALCETTDANLDFVGHAGGDDFIVLLQSTDWRARLIAALDRFDREARVLYDPQSIAEGGFLGEDRDGRQRVFPLVGMATGVISIPRGGSYTSDDVIALASKAKRAAKRAHGRFYELRLESANIA